MDPYGDDYMGGDGGDDTESTGDLVRSLIQCAIIVAAILWACLRRLRARHAARRLSIRWRY